MPDIIKAGTLLHSALNAMDAGSDPRAYIVQAINALIESPPAVPPDLPVPGFPDLVVLQSGPYVGMLKHLPTGTVLPEAQMKDYVARLAGQWGGGQPPGWDSVYKGLGQR